MSRALCQCILFFGKHQKFRRFFCLLAESGELVGAAFAWIEWRFMDTPPLSAEAKLMLGGGLALAAGVLIGSAQEASLACGADCGPRRRPPEFVDKRQAEGIRRQTQKHMARMGRGVGPQQPHLAGG